MRLAIDRTWDGVPLSASEMAQVDLGMSERGLEVAVDAPYYGDPTPPREPGPCDGLWEYEVVEVFVVSEIGRETTPRYTELELSPHGHFLLLEFEGSRREKRRAEELERSVRLGVDRWVAQATIESDWLPPQPWRVNAYAIHGVGAARRYLACTPVPGDRPDFHRVDLFPPAPPSS